MTNRGRNFSRRSFIAGSGSVLLSAALKLNGTEIPETKPEPIIDIHQHKHYHGWTDEIMMAHQQTMGVTRSILLPAGSPANTASTHFGLSNGLEAKAGGNAACYEFARVHPKNYLFGVSEVPDLPNATEEIEKYLKLGAVVIGELKFGVDCDSKEMQRIYQLAQEYNVPVLMHWEFKKYNFGFERFDKMLEKYPKVNFIGHAVTWWANIDLNHTDQSLNYPKGKVTMGGLTDRYLSDYPNMYGDLSAGSGLNAVTRDEEHAKQFLARHQDKLVYGSDCADHHGLAAQGCTGAQMIEKIRQLSVSKKMERKLLYENAKNLFRI